MFIALLCYCPPQATDYSHSYRNMRWTPRLSEQFTLLNTEGQYNMDFIHAYFNINYFRRKLDTDQSHYVADPLRIHENEREDGHRLSRARIPPDIANILEGIVARKKAKEEK